MGTRKIDCCLIVDIQDEQLIIVAVDFVSVITFFLKIM